MITSSSDSLFCSENPLINPPALSHNVPALDKIKEEHYLPAILWGITKAKEEIAAIRNNPEQPTFKNTIEALSFAGSDLGRIATIFETMCSSNTNDRLRAIEDSVNSKLSHYSSDLLMDSALFFRIKNVYEQADHMTLTEEQSTLLSETHRRFIHSGVHLVLEKKSRLKAINEQLSELSTQFKNNTVKANAAYKRVVSDAAELNGIPERAKIIYRSQAQNAGYTHGELLLLLEPYPSDAMMYCKNRALREELYKATYIACCEGEFDNSNIIMEIVRLRHEKAQLIGYTTYADLVLSGLMAGNVQTVQAFLEGNLAVYKAAAESDLQELRAFALATDGLSDLRPWDMDYYSNLLKEQKFNFKTEDLRPYFDLEKVLNGMFLHAEKLFGITFHEEKTGKYPVYHPDVKTYEVHDKKTHALIGIFYGDYYARPGNKNGGAWLGIFRNRGLYQGMDQIPLATNNCNFTKPTPQQPSLLSIRDVEIVFHEFGHGLHALLAEGHYGELTCTNVKRDFVELPSQLMENWVMEPEVLAGFAHHYQTGETIPEKLLCKLRNSKNFLAGTLGLRQTFLALLDIAYHTIDPAQIASASELEKSIAARATLLEPQYGLRSNGFTHIFSGGYESGYYSYKWAGILEADVFEAFKQKGLYDPTLGERLRVTIYSKGGTVDPMKLYERMMGRAPDADALFRRDGLLPI